MHRHYIGMTSHFIHTKFVLEKVILGCFLIEGKKDNLNIKTISDMVIENFIDPLTKIVYVSDNGPNIKAAFKNNDRIYCVCHAINNFIKFLLPEKNDKYANFELLNNKSSKIVN